ncbi:unnamed protein product [Larinioides sclopetarius]|uniref:Insulin-like domain-containing protein n=1 Tax=Larinioides sclopetarius TaxID=280406 RepID=A0AAV1YW11_9ARAC
MWIKFGSIVALLVGAVVADPLIRRTRGVLCGKKLSDAVSLVCGNDIYVPREIRNSPLGLMKDSEALSFLGRLNRQHRGIVEECCHKSCTVQELQSYCGK